MKVYHFIHHAWHFFLIDEIDIANYADESTPYTMWHTPYIMIKPETVGKKYLSGLWQWNESILQKVRFPFESSHQYTHLS